MVDSKKLRLLEKKQYSDFSEKDWDKQEKFVEPFLQTDAFFEETANLKLKHLPNGGVSIEKVVKKLDKDRVSATIYVLWLINEFYRDIYAQSEYEFTCLCN